MYDFIYIHVFFACMPYVHECLHVCVCNIWIGVKLLNRFPWFIGLQGAVAPLQVYCQRRHLQLVVIPDLISLAYLRFSVMGRGSTQEPPCRPFEHVNFFCTAVAIWNYFRPIMIGSAASEPSSEQGRRKHTSHWSSRWVIQFSPVRFTGMFMHVRCIPQQ